MTLTERHLPILVTGAAGLLGHALGPRLRAAAPGAGAVRLTDVADLDATDPAAVAAALRDIRPRTVINLAAWTNVDGAESHPAEAARLNADLPEVLARAAGAGAVLVQLSTDFIFDGAKGAPYVEDDPPRPLGVYGRTKAEGEARVRAAAPGAHLIVRTAWLYGAGGKNFVDTILGVARQGKPLRVVTDQVGCPTWNEDLAAAIVALVAGDVRGTCHACGAGEASWWDVADEAVRAAGLDAPVERITTEAMPRPARRPARSVLSTERLARETGFRFPPWRESVRAYVASCGR